MDDLQAAVEPSSAVPLAEPGIVIGVDRRHPPEQGTAAALHFAYG
jgi:hypothetical protein